MPDERVVHLTDKNPLLQTFRVEPARTQLELDAIRDLFAAYAASLPVSLDYQDFRSEIADLPGKYAPPQGELLIVWDKMGRHVGCVGLRPFGDARACEMKHLYVVQEARSFGLGKVLTEAIIDVARKCGYLELFLDTLPTMSIAARLYERMGFHRIDAYYGPTPPGTIFMKHKLARI
jgi:GNAT superfamily N-acetyltransferase